MKRTLLAIAFLFAATLTAARGHDQRQGRIVLLGFRPQHRGQTHATFPMIFNALYWGRE